MLSVKNVNNGAQLMENVLHVSIPLISPSMVSVSQLNQLVLKSNTLMQMEIALMLILYAKTSKKSVENVLDVFGAMNTMHLKRNALKLSVKKDNSQIISENVSKPVTFVAKHLTPEETV